MINSIRACRGALMLVATVTVVVPNLAQAQLRAELVAQGFSQPLAIVADPTDANTLFIVEQRGTIRAVVDGVTEATPFLDLTAEVEFEGEQGLLSLAFAADGERLFVCWVKRRTPDDGVGDVVISRFHRSANPLVADPSTRFDLVWSDGRSVILQPTEGHKGGNIQFGPDGYLYVGLGDGGGGDHPMFNAQNPALLLGKMLRIDVNVADADPRGYRVPDDNPFVPDDDPLVEGEDPLVEGEDPLAEGEPIVAEPEIWSFGYRNPWRWSFDDFGDGATRALIVGDVGQESREEINYEPAGQGGRNYGWFIREGTIATPGVSPSRDPEYLPLTDPIVDYPRSIGRAVTGGYVYRGRALHSAYRGRYFVADYFGGIYSLGLAIDVYGEARVVDVIDHTVELGSPRFIPTFGRGLDGELYFSSFVGGRIFKIVRDTRALPSAPEGVTSHVDRNTVSLAWEPSLSRGPVLGYQLEVGSASGLADLVVSETLSSTLVVPDVPDGVYFVRVRASNSAGLSEPSAERVVRVGCASEVPAVPSDLTGSVTPAGEVTVSWSPVDDAASYVIEVGSTTEMADLVVLPVQTSEVSGALPAGTYYVRVRAITACGATPPSNEIVVSVP